MRQLTAVLTLTFSFLVAGLALAHGHGHVVGTIKAVTADHLEVTTKDGKTVSVPLTAETKYFKGDQQAAQVDVKVGERVVVHLGAKGEAEEVRLPSGKTSSSQTHAGLAQMGGPDGMEHSGMAGMDHDSMAGMNHGGMTMVDPKPAATEITDPVCGMRVANPEAAPRSVYAGKVYYFCSKEDKAKFDKDPETYLKKKGS